VIPEPFGQVVIEGMAAGMPVIATAAGGPTEVITDRVDGILVSPNDIDALAHQLLRLRNDQEYSQRLGIAARARAQDFSTSRVAQQVRDLWRVLPRSSAPRWRRASRAP
jgi:glycosyltransferase involved in cell wall biosynthesis